MSTFYPVENRLGIASLYNIDTTAKYSMGNLVRAIDTTLGQGEFLYLQGVASTVAGSLVTFNTSTGATTLAPNTANLAQPVAVALAASTASQYGWYQVSGAAVIKKTAVKVNPNVALYLSGTAGRVMPTAASGKQILGCRSINAATVASATSTITAVIERPHAQGQVV